MIPINHPNIITNPFLITGSEQCRTHKKKRINKKWAKKYGYKPIYDMEHIYIIDEKLYMSLSLFNKLKESI